MSRVVVVTQNVLESCRSLIVVGAFWSCRYWSHCYVTGVVVGAFRVAVTGAVVTGVTLLEYCIQIASHRLWRHRFWYFAC
ncbi:hypothetical protein C2G38_2157603 [Gigaspora rosea]|uniref:Uncharacterized protein n=1 Tax=Gigaspora rosea TaxID=44941 RepID=A0A397W1D0_9GLOM|nr:hypothetical protein C2G38_2157603 [Gigaspora rosea]